MEDGLSSHQAYDIVQDKNGFIWVSTRVGIDRYDGENIVNYDYPGNTNISYSVIRLKIDQDKNLWAFTEDGSIYSFKEGIDGFKLVLSFRDSIDSNALLLNFHVDTNAWLCTDDGLWLFEPENRKIIEIPNFKEERVTLVSPYSKNRYLISLTNKLVEYNRKENKVDTLFSFKDVNLNSEILSVHWDSLTNEIWIGTQTGEIFIYNVVNGTVINLKDRIPKLPEVPVFKIVSSDQKEVYIGSDGGGVFKIDRLEKKLLDNYKEDVDDVNSMVGNGVRDLYMSEDGNLYITSYTGGLNILSNNASGFNIVRHQINNANSLRNNVVNNILEDFDGDIWFATNNGVSCWLKRENKWKHYLDDSNSVGNVFLSLLQYDRKTIIAGSYGKGIYYINKNNGVIDHFFPSKRNSQKQANADYIVDIFKDRENKIWFGDTFKELAIYNPDKDSYNYIPLVGVKSIQAKNNENIFIGTLNGVYSVNIHTLEFQKIQLPNELPTSFFVNSLTFDSKNQVLWIATSGLGLLKYNVISNEIQQLNTEDGFSSNHIYAVLKYGENIIWASSEKGLIRYNIKDGNIENFSIKDGLSDNAFYKNSKCKTKSGQFYFGSYNGATYFNPENVKAGEENATIFFEKLLINNKMIHAKDKKSVLKEPLDQTKDLALKYNESSFSIGFTSITPVNSGKIKYSWKLEGQDVNWTIPSYNKQANYTNVPKGDFQFQLKALSDRTEQVLDERQINVTVKPAPFNTLWARISYGLFLIILVGSIYKYVRISDMKKLSEAKIQFFINAAHDIKTPISLAIAPLSDLQRSKNLDEKDKYLLDLSYSNISNLSNSVIRLLDFQKSDMGKNQLILSKENIIRLVEDRYIYFKQLAEKNNIRFDCEIEPSHLKEWIDISKIEKVLDNLLSNAFKYTKQNGKVIFRLSSNQSEWKILVKDSGIGIPQDAQKSLFKRYFRGENAINTKVSGTGIGLLLAKNYVLLHKGNLQFNSRENEGSEFVISFKKGNKHFGENVRYTDNPTDISLGSISNNVKKINKKTRFINKKKSFKKLLVVEDNDKLRSYLIRILSEHYQTYEAEDGRVALKKVESVLPDIIVSDIGMPNITGIELTNQLKNKFETSHIPIILLTAFDDNNDVINGLNSGADDYITKPFDISILIARIETILKNREKIKERFIKYQSVKIEKGTFTNVKDQEFIEKAILYVENNIDDPELSKDKFAKELFVSSSLLYKKLKALTGQSPSEFVRMIKLKKAFKYLEEGGKSIQEVAFLTGFTDSKYFSTSFKKMYGKTPSNIFKKTENSL